MEVNYKAALEHIQTFCFDVDGVFTNNIVILSQEGEQLRTANVRDGFAVQLAIKKGLNIVIISGGKGENVRRRFEGLGVQHIFLGVSEKLPLLEKFLMEHHISPSNCCYMGDDIPDFFAMKHVGLACCPGDAVPEIKAISHYVSSKNGGEGCVRDLLEQALKVKGHWNSEAAYSW